MPDLAEYVARGAQASDRLDRDVRFFTVGDLAKRWHVAESTVRAIPFDRLPWVNLGRGLRRVARRYKPADVARYEETYR